MRLARRSGRREAPGSARHMQARLDPVSSRRHIEPCMRFSRTRLTDALHRRHSALSRLTRQSRKGLGVTTSRSRLTSPMRFGDTKATTVMP